MGLPSGSLLPAADRLTIVAPVDTEAGVALATATGDRLGCVAVTLSDGRRAGELAVADDELRDVLARQVGNEAGVDRRGPARRRPRCPPA